MLDKFVVKRRYGALRPVLRAWQLYALLLPTLLYVTVFHYGPMYGVVIAFKNFMPALGISKSPWAGLVHFERFFRIPTFWRLIGNTLLLNVYALLAGMPVPVLLALALHYTPGRRFKRFVQNVTYAPHFISTVVLVGMVAIFTSPNSGIVNVLYTRLTGNAPIFFMGDARWFRSLYVISGVWQGAGWGSIIYLAALSGIDPCLHEAAEIDGASLPQRIRHIDLPGIAPTFIILLIMSCGRMMNVGFEKVFLFQNALNLATSEVISTYVYHVGLQSGQYSYSAAVGLFNSLVNLVLLVLVNQLSRKLGETSLW